jgi:hypothetical protein
MVIARMVLQMILASSLQLTVLQSQPDVKPRRSVDELASKLRNRLIVRSLVLVLDQMWWPRLAAAQYLGEYPLQCPLQWLQAVRLLPAPFLFMNLQASLCYSSSLVELVTQMMTRTPLFLLLERQLLRPRQGSLQLTESPLTGRCRIVVANHLRGARVTDGSLHHLLARSPALNVACC